MSLYGFYRGGKKMSILGPYSGERNKVASYLYGPHWKGMKGFKVQQGESAYNHRFGGDTWKVPRCKNCHEAYHQVFTFDLNDTQLEDIKVEGLNELPLVSCLNCSTVWEPQLFKINIADKEIEILEDKDTQKWIQDKAERIPSPLPEVSVKLVEMQEKDIPTTRDIYYEIFETFGEEYICRLLGAPLYIQSAIDRECPICKKEMQYIASIISESYDAKHIINGVEFFIGEMSLYYFLCKECRVIKTDCQGT